jgi:gliding motility-associated-like protein
MKLNLIFIAIILSTTSVLGQYTSVGGRFSVDEKKGCAEFTINILSTNLITVGECTPGKPCVMEWGDGTANQTNTFQHPYSQPGTYTLRILYQTIGYDEIQVTVTPNTQPAFDIYTCGNRTVQVKVTDTNYDAYIIDYNDATSEVTVPKGAGANDTHTYATAGAKTISVRGINTNAADNCTPPNIKTVNAVASLTAPFIDLLTVSSSTQIDLDFNNALYSDNVQYRVEIAVNSNALANFQAAQTLLNVNTTTLTTVRPDDNYYCFRLGATDVCNSVSTYSNIICSSKLNLALQNKSNRLTWTTASIPGTNFDINRDGATINTTTLFNYADNTVVCKTPYCYQVVTNYTNGSQSISLEKCGTAFSTDVPTAIENITSVVSSTGVDLTWQQDAAFQPLEYKVFRKSGGGNFSLLTTSAITSLLDEGYTTEGEYCYKINYTDVCDNASNEGNEVCPIRLSGKIEPINKIKLTWNDYSGWMVGVDNYQLEVYDELNALIGNFSLNPGVTEYVYDDVNPLNQVNKFILKANANDASFGQSVSNEEIIIKKTIAIFPTAFVPTSSNNDINVFKVIVPTDFLFVKNFQMQIFNRWGELIFVSDAIDKGWDGKSKGAIQPEGTYVYIAKYTDLANRTFERSGSFVLLRN